jgi:hypothetical protein
VHHRTIQINHQPNAIIFQFIILKFVHSSTCFGRFPAHHQERNDCSGSLWFCLRIVVIVVLCSWSGRPTTNTELSYQKLCSYNRRPEDENIVARNMYRIQINQKKLCVKLVTYQNYTKMHGQKNIKFCLKNITCSSTTD